VGVDLERANLHHRHGDVAAYSTTATRQLLKQT